MPDSAIDPKAMETMQGFYDLMEATRDARAEVVAGLFTGKQPDPALIRVLERARALLGRAVGPDNRARLKVDESVSIPMDLTYEITELDKDVIFLTQGEPALLAHLADIHPGFEAQTAGLAAYLDDRSFNCFITDRDGTVNNYCSGYRSSVQSAYNAVWLTRFAKTRCESPIIITSAPLKDHGIMNLCVFPEDAFIYAASKGREFLDLKGERRVFPIAPEKQKALDELNRRLAEMVSTPQFHRFALIGSGLQFKFGQTTLARQEVSGSIDPADSEGLLGTVRDLVAELDPERENFRIEDTGLDIEIILTIEAAGGLKDFDKGDAVGYLDGELDLGMEKGPHLVCGDTPSDLPMAGAALERCPDTLAVFVTAKPDLKASVKAAKSDWRVVDTPDMLVAALGAEL